jgi:hypothetical protein
MIDTCLGGHLNTLKWLFPLYDVNRPRPANDIPDLYPSYAAQEGHLHILEYLFTLDLYKFFLREEAKTIILNQAILSNKVSIVKFLREKGFDWNAETFNQVFYIGKNKIKSFTGDFSLINFLFSNGCPIDKDRVRKEVLENPTSISLYVAERLNLLSEVKSEIKVGLKPLIAVDQESLKKETDTYKAAEMLKDLIDCTILRSDGELGTGELETEYYSHAIKTKKLNLIKEFVKAKIPLTQHNIAEAAYHGNLEILAYCIDVLNLKLSDVKDDKIFRWASSGGNLEVVKFLFEKGFQPTKNTTSKAAEFGHIEVLKYFKEKDCPVDEDVCKKYLLEHLVKKTNSNIDLDWIILNSEKIEQTTQGSEKKQ